MNTHIANYLLHLTGCAIVCSMVRTLFADKKGYSGVIRLICGVFMSISLLTPLLHLPTEKFFQWEHSLKTQGEQYCLQGKNTALEEYRKIIKERSEEYIYDKAAELKADIQTEIQLSSGENPVPQSVTIIGALSPFARTELSQIIVSHLGIAKENQSWIPLRQNSEKE